MYVQIRSSFPLNSLDLGKIEDYLTASDEDMLCFKFDEEDGRDDYLFLMELLIEAEVQHFEVTISTADVF